MLATTQVSSRTLSSSNKRINHLIALARENCLNRADLVNFNQYGCQDNIGLEPVSDHYIDTVMLRRPIPSNTDPDFAANSTAEMSYFFASRGLRSSRVLSIMPCGVKQEFQQWKIACPDAPVDHMLQILKELPNFEVTSIDVTRDFAGSFDLTELVQHFEETYDLRTGFTPDHLFMEKDMIKDSGHTCFVCKQGPIRYKAYLKFPQMLLKGQVRENIGNNWMAWIRHRSGAEDCLFFRSRNATRQRGMTRIEITVSCNNETLPSISELKCYLDSFVEKMPPKLIYSTPHEAMWRAFADCFQHTLIVVDEEYEKKGLAIMAYAIDRDTRDVCGFILDEWTRCMLHAMARFTLSSRLPIDVIRVSPVRKEKGGVETLEICGARYDKVHKKDMLDVTYLTNKTGSFSANKDKFNIEEVGFVPHPNCTLHLPDKRYTIKSKVPAEIQLKEELQVIIPDETGPSPFLSKTDYDKTMPVYYHSTPDLLPPMNCQQLPVFKLSNMMRGSYDVYGIIGHKKGYPRMVVAIGDELYIVYMSKELQQLCVSCGVDTTATNIENFSIARITIRYHRKRKSGGSPMSLIDFKLLEKCDS